MRRFPLGLIAVGVALSLSAYAAIPTDSAPFQVKVPNLKRGYEFTVEGLYLKPTNSDLDYASVSTSGQDTVKAIRPGYSLGFRVNADYVFPNSGNDARISWTHLNSSDSNSVVGANVNDGHTAASGTVKFKYDAIDLDAGQFLDVGTRLQLHMFAGLRYANLQRNFNITGTGGALADDINLNTSKFAGIGPRFGIDTAYHVRKCFGVVGHFAAALLVGKEKVNSTEVGSNYVSSDDTYRVVPGLDAKLGGDYSIHLSGGSLFTIEAGYQVTQYFDVVDRLNQSSNHVATSSLGFNGPYLSLNFKA